MDLFGKHRNQPGIPNNIETKQLSFILTTKRVLTGPLAHSRPQHTVTFVPRSEPISKMFLTHCKIDKNHRLN